MHNCFVRLNEFWSVCDARGRCVSCTLSHIHFAHSGIRGPLRLRLREAVESQILKAVHACNAAKE